MNANQFRVVEHYSYDMIGVLMYELRNRNRPPNRLWDAVVKTDTVAPFKCRMYLFPDFQFNAKEYAKR